MGIYIVLIPSDGDDLMGPEIKTKKKKNASIMENVLPPKNSVFHKVLTRPQSSLIISIRRGRLERAL